MYDNLKKLIFVNPCAWTVRDYHRFGIGYFKDKGYMVKMATVWSKQRAARTIDVSSGMCNPRDVDTVIYSYFPRYIAKHCDWTFVFLEKQYIDYLKCIRKYKVDYIIVGNLGLIPDRSRDSYNADLTNVNITNDVQRKNNILVKCFRSLKNIFLDKRAFLYYIAVMRDIVKKRRLALELNSKTLRKPCAIIMATHASDSDLFEELVGDNLYYCHHRDYDRYIENLREGITVSSDYVVFIEEGIIGIDQDEHIFGYKKQIDISRWEKQCEILFDEIEKYLGIPVVVAGHPHSKYKKMTFAGRSIFLNCSEKLIPRAKAVMLIGSTIISQVLLYNKAVLCVCNFDTINYLKSSGIYDNYTTYMHEILGLNEFNLDIEKLTIENIKDAICTVDENARIKYIKTYIKQPDSESGLTYEILGEKINSISKI